MRKVVIILMLVFCYLSWVDFTSAQVIINEVLPQPINNDLEWVELKNTSSNSANLSGWFLEDVLSSPKTIFSFGLVEILPNQFFVATISGQLNNSADGVVLKDSLGNVVSQMSYSSSSLGLSWQLDGDNNFIAAEPSKGLENVSLSVSPTPSPTVMVTPPPSSNSPSPTPSNEQVTLSKLSQLYVVGLSSCPKNGSEWIDWINTGAEKIMATLVIKDLQANNLSLSIDIEPNQKLKTNLARHIFNNGGDELFVYFNEQLLINKNLPSCEAVDTVFSFSPDSSWPVEEVFNNADQVDLDLENTKQEIVGEIIKPVSKENVKSPNFLLPQIEILAASASSISASLTQSNDVLGLITESGVEKNLQPVLFLICGGFLWIGLVIIEIYGSVFFQNKALD